MGEIFLDLLYWEIILIQREDFNFKFATKLKFAVPRCMWSRDMGSAKNPSHATRDNNGQFGKPCRRSKVDIMFCILPVLYLVLNC